MSAKRLSPPPQPKIKSYLFNLFIENVREKCINCWCRYSRTLCLKSVVNGEKINLERKNEFFEKQRISTINSLKIYLKINPPYFNKLFQFDKEV